MKKLIFLVCCLIVLASCTSKYDEIKPEEPLNGTVVAIDSTKWTPVLMQYTDESILIYDGKVIKKVAIIDPMDTFLVGMLCLLVIILFIIAIVFS